MKNFKKQLGFNLIELMITITIGSFLILGAAFAFQEAQKTYITNDNVARLYEQAQYVLDTLEEDIRLNSFWGLHNRKSAVEGDSNATIPVAIATIAGDCDTQWALDLRTGLSGSNGVVSAGVVLPSWANAGGSCITSLTEAVEKKVLSNADTLVVRHADYQIVNAPVAGQVYVRSDEALPLARIFLGGAAVPNVGLNAQNFEMISHGYYVTADSYKDNDGVPMLRRMALINDAGLPRVVSQEVAAGVEDLQIKFGVDLNQKETPGYGSIDLYVDPDDARLLLPTTRVLSVRMWALLRGEEIERGFTSNAVYNYADATFNHPNDGFRRLLVSKTIQVRNMETQ